MSKENNGKNFDLWNSLKKGLEARSSVPEFSERDIWWCSLGLNVGYEEDGKNENFERPVCILRKFNKEIFVGLPLTSTRKGSPYYFPHKLHDTEGAILLSQGRLLSAKRLERKLGHIGKGKFKELRERYRNLYP
jgi:mRNA interferase MazF